MVLRELGKDSPQIHNHIEQLFHGARVPFEFGEIESSVFDVSPGKKRYSALTTYNQEGNPIGICDVMSMADNWTTVLQSPIIRKRGDLVVPAREIRILAGDDGIYVAEKFRNRHIGVVMLRTAMALSKRYGSRRFVVEYPGEHEEWYLKLGGKRALNAVVFKL